jgi:hypothetical protein
MHEFVCSESQPTMPLSISDLQTPMGCMYLGDIYLSVNPAAILSKPDRSGQYHPVVSVSCKSSASLLDIIAGPINLGCMKSLGVQAGSGDAPLSVSTLIDTSTCVLTCTRCGMVLGDGSIRADDNLAVTASNGDDTLRLSDLQDIRFYRDRINWTLRSLSNVGIELGLWREIPLDSCDTEGRLRQEYRAEQVREFLYPSMVIIYRKGYWKGFDVSAESL